MYTKMLKIGSNFKEEFKQIREIIAGIFPNKKDEIFLFIAIFLFFLSYSYFFVFKTSIIDSISMGDLYFSYDATSIFHRGSQSILPHPLIRFITVPILYISKLLVYIFADYKAKTFFWILICNTLGGITVVNVYRYLKNIIGLDKAALYILTLYFTFTSTSLILCFTTDSYVFSAPILTYILYYYSLSIKNKYKTGLTANIFFTISAAGITVTNYLFGVIPMLFTEEKKSNIIKKILIISFILAAILLIQFKNQFIGNAIGTYSYYAEYSGQYYEHAFDLFYGTPILLSTPIAKYFNYSGLTLGIIISDYYHYWWQYTYMGVISALVLISIFLNRKNKLIYIPLLFFIVNILIHVVFKYGLDEPFMYGGHWVYTIPIFLGWLYKEINKNHLKGLTIIYVVLLCFLIINNSIQMFRFTQLAIDLFPVY